MAFIEKRSKIIDFILTEKGKEDFTKGKLNIRYFSLADDEVDYSILSSSFNNNTTNIEAHVPCIPILECFQRLNDNELVTPTLYDYDIRDGYVPVLTGSRDSSSTHQINVTFSPYIKGLLASTDNSKVDEMAVLTEKIGTGIVKQEDFYKHDDLDIILKVKSGDNDLTTNYGITITAKRVSDGQDLLIKKKANSNGIYIIGERIKEELSQEKKDLLKKIYEVDTCEYFEYQGGVFKEIMTISIPNSEDYDTDPKYVDYALHSPASTYGLQSLQIVFELLANKIAIYKMKTMPNTKPDQLQEAKNLRRALNHQEFGAPKESR